MSQALIGNINQALFGLLSNYKYTFSLFVMLWWKLAISGVVLHSKSLYSFVLSSTWVIVKYDHPPVSSPAAQV